MPDTPAYLAGRLMDEGHKTEGFFNSLSPDQWQVKVYTEGTQWDIHQVLTHFVSAEVSFSALIKNILQGGEGAPENFNIDVYNEKKVSQMRGQSPAELIVQYTQARKMNVEMVSAMSPEDLERKGRHPYLGVAPLADMIKLIYRHNQIHQRDIRKMLE